jgi:hypothetical protein
MYLERKGSSGANISNLTVLCVADEGAAGRWDAAPNVLLRELPISNVILIDRFVSELNGDIHKGLVSITQGIYKKELPAQCIQSLGNM